MSYQDGDAYADGQVDQIRYCGKCHFFRLKLIIFHYLLKVLKKVTLLATFFYSTTQKAHLAQKKGQSPSDESHIAQKSVLL